MKKILLVVFYFTSFSLTAQSRLEFIMSKGYYIQNKSTDYLEDNVDIGKVISKEQFYSCLNDDVFNYFKELKEYDTKLKKKIFKEDNSKEYSSYLDSLAKLKDFYKNRFEYTLVSYSKYKETDLSDYNMNAKTFELIKEIKSFEKEDDIYETLDNVKNGKQSFEGLIFDPLKDIKQRAIISDFMEMYGVKIYKGQLKTEIKIHNERDALKIESGKPLKVLIVFNRFDTPKKVYRARKVLFFINDEVIQSYGSDKEIETLLKTSIPDSFQFKKQSTNNLNPFSGNGSGGSGTSGEGGGFGPDTRPESREGEPGTGAAGDRIRLSNIRSKPKTHNDERCKITYKLTVDSQGKVLRADIISNKTTTSNQRLIDEIAGLIKKEVRYKKKLGAKNEITYYTVSVLPG